MTSDATAPYALDAYDCEGLALSRVRDAAEAAFLGDLFAAMPPWSTLDYPSAQLAQFFLRADPALHRFAARNDEGRIVGAIAIRHPWLRGPYLEILGLAPDSQRRRHGAALMRWMERQAGLGSRNLWALVSAFNAEARRFYARVGFVEVAALADLVLAGKDEILLRKPLGR